MISTTEEITIAVPDIGTGDSVAYSKRWYVAMVRRHHERKISERLTAMGVENFVPIQRQVHQWSDRRKIVDCVLLPMMVFVRVTPRERMEVLTLSTVSRYMTLRGESTPAVIPDEQMARFRFMLDYSEETISMDSSPLGSGEEVRVIKGSLIGLTGELITMDGKCKVAVRLNMLGSACVDMSADSVTAVDKKKRQSTENLNDEKKT